MDTRPVCGGLKTGQKRDQVEGKSRDRARDGQRARDPERRPLCVCGLPIACVISFYLPWCLLDPSSIGSYSRSSLDCEGTAKREAHRESCRTGGSKKAVTAFQTISANFVVSVNAPSTKFSGLLALFQLADKYTARWSEHVFCTSHQRIPKISDTYLDSSRLMESRADLQQT